MKKIRIGAINWDAALPEDTFFGTHMQRTLSPEQYRNRIPFYADVKEGKLSFHRRTEAEFNQELEYAIRAGIDFFAYVWYSEESLKNLGYSFPDPGDVSGEVWELSEIRKYHLRSPLRDKIKMCAYLGAHPLTQADLVALALQMQQSYYEKMGEQPLVFLFGGNMTALKDRLTAVCRLVGTKDPFFVFKDEAPGSTPGDYVNADAIGAYGCGSGESRDYAGYMDRLVQYNESLKRYQLPVLPVFSLGWNPMPRVTTPVPWVRYADQVYPEIPGRQQVYDSMVSFTAWLRANADNCCDHVLVFAWNEFEEGGFACPTLSEGGQPCTEILDGLTDAIRYLKTNLTENENVK